MDENRFEENIDNENNSVEENPEFPEQISAADEDETTMQIDGFTAEKSENSSVGKEIFEWVQAIVVAFVIAMFLRTFVFTMVVVDGSSMEPTLHHGERMVVSRMTDNYEYGDVVVFRPVESPETPYIKRVIATEGQTISFDFSTGLTKVDGEVIYEPYIMEAISPYMFGSFNPYTKAEAVVPENCIFVMGDNRNHSSDSRTDSVGMVSEESVIGKVVFRFWPIDKFGTDFKVEK